MGEKLEDLLQLLDLRRQLDALLLVLLLFPLQVLVEQLLRVVIRL